MKRLLLLSAALLWGSAAIAHPPKNIAIAINGDVITLTIEHQVKDPTNHYIINVLVDVNGNKMITQKFVCQADGVNQIATYNYPGLKKGDKITAEATCNKFGTKKQEITL